MQRSTDNTIKKIILILIINMLFVGNCSLIFAFSKPADSTLSPQLVLNVSNIHKVFLDQVSADSVIVIEKTADLEIPESYKQQINSDFFVKALSDWVAAQEKLIGIGPAFFAFGSARFKPGHYWYEQAQLFGRMAAENYISIITGGGPGIMLGANHGAYGINGVDSIGLGMLLPHEKNVDHHVYKNLVNIFDIFFTRKLMFIEKSLGGVTMPGGFGSLDEIFEVLAFNIRYPDMAIPNVLVDDKFYGGLMDVLSEIHSQGLMPKPEDVLLTVKSTTEEAFEYLRLTTSREKKSMDINLKVFVHDLMRASRLLTRIGPSVSIIGGTETQRDSVYFPMAKDLSSSLNALNINVIRRGNRGIAEAIGQAYDVQRAESKGLFIALHEDGRGLNGNSADKSLHFDYYFALKLALIEHSKFGMIVFPGGVDTFDVLCEMLCLIKTNKIAPVPIVLVGRDAWQPFLDWVKAEMVPMGTINEDYLDLVHVVDNEFEAQQIILDYIEQLKKITENEQAVIDLDYDAEVQRITLLNMQRIAENKLPLDIKNKYAEGVASKQAVRRKLIQSMDQIVTKAIDQGYLLESSITNYNFIGQAI